MRDARQARRAAPAGRQGLPLLDGVAWTPALDFQNSLALRSERTMIDSSAPYSLRLEQIYSPSIELTPGDDRESDAAQARAAAGGRERAAPPPPPRELGTFDGNRDLRESPLAMELDLAGVEDGNYVIEAEVFDGTTSIGTATLGVFCRRGSTHRLRALETSAATATPAARADILYPGDFIKNINRGRITPRDFNAAAEIARLKRSWPPRRAARIRSRARPAIWSGTTCSRRQRDHAVPRLRAEGVHRRHGVPLVMALHGLGANEDSFFDSYPKLPPQLAEKHGFLLAAPLGYRVDGFYGSTIMGAATPPRRRGEYSEKDVMEVLRLMKANYKVDESRIYLIGHSMGAIGTWALARSTRTSGRRWCRFPAPAPGARRAA